MTVKMPMDQKSLARAAASAIRGKGAGYEALQRIAASNSTEDDVRFARWLLGDNPAIESISPVPRAFMLNVARAETLRALQEIGAFFQPGKGFQFPNGELLRRAVRIGQFPAKIQGAGGWNVKWYGDPSASDDAPTMPLDSMQLWFAWVYAWIQSRDLLEQLCAELPPNALPDLGLVNVEKNDVVQGFTYGYLCSEEAKWLPQGEAVVNLLVNLARLFEPFDELYAAKAGPDLSVPSLQRLALAGYARAGYQLGTKHVLLGADVKDEDVRQSWIYGVEFEVGERLRLSQAAELPEWELTAALAKAAVGCRAHLKAYRRYDIRFVSEDSPFGERDRVRPQDEGEVRVTFDDTVTYVEAQAK